MIRVSVCIICNLHGSYCTAAYLLRFLLCRAYPTRRPPRSSMLSFFHEPFVGTRIVHGKTLTVARQSVGRGRSPQSCQRTT